MGKHWFELDMTVIPHVFICLLSQCLASPFSFQSSNTRVPNPCLTKANETCIFPFTYNGVEYYRCTYADSPTPWCATMVPQQHGGDQQVGRLLHLPVLQLP